MANKAGRRNFGSIRPFRNGRSQVVVPGPVTGQLVAMGTFATKTAAEAALTDAAVAQRKGRWTNPTAGRQTLAEWIEGWWPTKQLLRAKTLDQYSLIPPELGAKRLDQLTPPLTAGWRSGLLTQPNLAESTTVRITAAVFAWSWPGRISVGPPRKHDLEGRAVWVWEGVVRRARHSPMRSPTNAGVSTEVAPSRRP